MFVVAKLLGASEDPTGPSTSRDDGKTRAKARARRVRFEQVSKIYSVIFSLCDVKESDGDCFVGPDSEASDGVVPHCTPRQAARLGEVVASEVENRTIEPLVASELFAVVMLLFGRVRHWLFALYLFVVLVLEFQVLDERMEQRLEVAISTSRRHKRTYSSRRRLRRDMVGDHPVYSLFVSGSNIRSDEKFYCPICHRDVSMRSRGAGEFSRHFFLTDTGRQM